ncbi:hypothetical protein MMC27_008610 [Xylographa pallens]|nr:hypothetical protein [Xylographa pallens]
MQQSNPKAKFTGYHNQRVVSLELTSDSDSLSISLPSSSSSVLTGREGAPPKKPTPSTLQHQQQQKVATTARHDDDVDNDMRNRNEMQRPLLPVRVSGSPLDTPTDVAIPTERQQKLHRADTVLGRWWSEILSCGCMLLALLATVVTLVLHQGRTIPEWPLAITINAAISIYATVLQMSMVYVLAESLSQMKWVWYSKPRPLKDLETFDSASRGPWGATKLIWTLRASHIAALGALLIIASLAIGPFLQQIVSTNSCQIIADGVQATIPTSNIKDLQPVEMGIAAAIMKGLISPVANSSTVIPSCSTGNCTFQEYKSMGISSDCQDITDTLEITCSHDLDYNCTYSLASGIGLLYDAALPTEAEVFTATLYTPNATWAFMGYEIISINAMEEGESRYNGSLSMQATAYKCQFGQSIGTYTASVTNGHLEEILSSITLASSSIGQTTPVDSCDMSLVMVDLSCLSASERELLASHGHNMHDDLGYIALNVTYCSGTGGWNTTYAPMHCMYAFFGTDAIETFMNSLLQSDNFVAGYLDEYSKTSDTWCMLDFLYQGGNATLSSINSTMASIANSLTLTMRSIVLGPQDYNASYNKKASYLEYAPAIGIAYRTEVCVQVQWEWLSLPVILATMTVLFFIFTLLAPRGQRRGGHVTRNDWKSSMVALLFHGLEGRARERLGALNYSSEMEESAERMVVQLQCGNEGWRFVET